MAGLTLDELCQLAANHALLVKGGVSDVTAVFTYTAGTQIDSKNQTSYVQSLMRGAIAAWLASVARSPRHADIWSACRKSKGLQVGSSGFYTLGDGNPLSGGGGDGEELSALTDDDAKIDGHIVTVEVTFDTPSAAPVSGPANPFGSSTAWAYAEPDSAAATRRRRVLEGILLTPLYSYEVVGRDIHTAGTGVRVTYVPSDFGDAAGETVPREYMYPILSEFFAIFYGQAAGGSGVQAAQYYSGRAAQYRQELYAGNVDFQPLPPFQGM